MLDRRDRPPKQPDGPPQGRSNPCWGRVCSTRGTGGDDHPGCSQGLWEPPTYSGQGFVATPRPRPLLWSPRSPSPRLNRLYGRLLGSRRGQGLLLLSSGWGGLRGGKLAALCLPGRYRLQLEGRHLLGTPFGCSLGSYSLHRGGVHAGCRHLRGGTRPTVEAFHSLTC